MLIFFRLQCGSWRGGGNISPSSTIVYNTEREGSEGGGIMIPRDAGIKSTDHAAAVPV